MTTPLQGDRDPLVVLVEHEDVQRRRAVEAQACRRFHVAGAELAATMRDPAEGVDGEGRRCGSPSRLRAVADM